MVGSALLHPSYETPFRVLLWSLSLLRQTRQYNCPSDALLISFTQSGSWVIPIGVFVIGPPILTVGMSNRPAISSMSNTLLGSMSCLLAMILSMLEASSLSDFRKPVGTSLA
jgi:hypothetical protein